MLIPTCIFNTPVDSINLCDTYNSTVVCKEDRLLHHTYITNTYYNSLVMNEKKSPSLPVTFK